MRARFLFSMLVTAVALAPQTVSAQTPLHDAARADVAAAAEKYIGLAKAMPQSAYGWRPAEGVRSVSEVFVHVANANYLFPSFLGVDAPAGAMPQNAEQTMTNQAQVVAALERSFAFLSEAIGRVDAATLGQSVDLFGNETTRTGALLTTITHLHEHLGQAIAYARSNGVTPPWSGNE